MQNHELFKWTFTGSGLWLMLSPFLLHNDQLAFSDADTRDAGTFVIAGLLALVIASYTSKKQNLVRAFTGFAFGMLVIAAPSTFGFKDIVATWNASFVGTILVLVALYDVYWHLPGRRTM